MNILEIKNLSKRFGEDSVIKNLDLSIQENTIVGFIGQNGAGKTTTMKMILGLLKQDSGTVIICGEQVSYGETKTNRFVGYLPDVPAFYPFMNAGEYLKLCGEITGLEKRKIKEKTAELLKLVGLDSVLHKKIGSYSRGMKQRLGIAQALLNEPKLLICDEPTSALDPSGRKEILDILASVRNKTTVIFSTHVLSDIERICDTVAILKDGKIALNGTLDDIKNMHAPHAVKIEFGTREELDFFMDNYRDPDIQAIDFSGEKSVLVHSTNLETSQNRMYKFFSENSLYPKILEQQVPTLENLFMEVIS